MGQPEAGTIHNYYYFCNSIYHAIYSFFYFSLITFPILEGRAPGIRKYGFRWQDPAACARFLGKITASHGSAANRALKRANAILKREEILEELFAGVGEHGFGVELDAGQFMTAVL